MDFILGNVELTEEELSAVDLNHDGVCNVLDLVKLKKDAAGRLTGLKQRQGPCGKQTSVPIDEKQRRECRWGALHPTGVFML